MVVLAGVEYEDEKQLDIVASGGNCLSLVWKMECLRLTERCSCFDPGGRQIDGRRGGESQLR